MKISLLSVLLIFLFTNCSKSGQDQTVVFDSSIQDVSKMIDDWHKAAAEANEDEYFAHFYDDSSIFMGTDDTERWTAKEFRVWSKPYFDRGKAWSFTAFDRHIFTSDDGKTAWFDERLKTQGLGPCRGTGVCKLVDGKWKIAHYNLSIPIPNDIQAEVTEMVLAYLKKANK